MKRKRLNDNWLFCKGGGTALDHVISGKEPPVSVALPHDAMILNERKPDILFGNCVGYFPYETVHYTKAVHLDEANCVYLEFEGVYMNCSVFVNNCLVGQHANGYTPFLLDVSQYVHAGENKLKVVVRNGVPSSR